MRLWHKTYRDREKEDQGNGQETREREVGAAGGGRGRGRTATNILEDECVHHAMLEIASMVPTLPLRCKAHEMQRVARAHLSHRLCGRALSCRQLVPPLRPDLAVISSLAAGAH